MGTKYVVILRTVFIGDMKNDSDTFITSFTSKKEATDYIESQTSYFERLWSDLSSDLSESTFCRIVDRTDEKITIVVTQKRTTMCSDVRIRHSYIKGI